MAEEMLNLLTKKQNIITMEKITMNKKIKNKFIKEAKKTFEDREKRSIKVGNVKIDIISI